MEIYFKKLNDSAIIPAKKHKTDSGFDMFANEDVIILPGQTTVIKTGISIILPRNTEAQIRPRSGITSKTSLKVQLGTVDQGYTGEIGIILDNIITTGMFKEIASSLGFNHKKGYFLVDGSFEESKKKYPKGTYKIKKGDKLAQLVAVNLPDLIAVEYDGVLPDSSRGTSGFGDSGVR